MIKAIFFDFDGVIVESVDIKTQAFAQLFKSEGKIVVEKVVEYHLKNTGVSRFEKFQHIYKEILKRGLSNEIFQCLCDRFSELVVDAVVNAPYVAGVKEFLENTSFRYRCFIASATPQQEMEEIIKKRGLQKFFIGVYGSPKKKTDIVRDVLLEKKFKPEESVYIGDALSDYIAARNNSVNFIARINGNESIFSDIDCIKVRDLTNLSKIIESL